MTGGRKALAKGLFLVGIATLTASAAAYVLSIIAARLLTPADFGGFGAMIGSFLILATLALAIQTLAARSIASGGQSDSDLAGSLVRLSVFIAIAVAVVGLVASYPLGIFLDIPYLAMLFNFFAVSAYVVGYVAMGIAQGHERHGVFSASMLANGAGRAAIGIVFVLAWPTITGVSLGIFVGCAVGAAISYWLSCRRTWSSSVGKSLTVQYGHVAHALVVLFLLTNVDVLLARVFLTADASGEYAVGVLVAKIAFFLPVSVLLVLFPRMAAATGRTALFAAIGLTAFIGVVITVGSWLFGTLVVRVVGGAQYLDLASLVWLFALEGSAFALVQVLLYSRLAAEDQSAVFLVWAALVALVLVVVFWANDSVTAIVTTVVVVSLALVVIGFIVDVFRPKQAADEAPVLAVD